MSAFNAFVEFVAKIVAPMQRQFINFIRIAIFIVMVWIGGLKVCQYEADGIAHFVSNSPFFSYMYKKGPNLVENDKGEMVMEYTLHKNPEGKMVAKNIEWHKENGTLLVTLTQSILAIKKSNSSVMNFLNISGSLMMSLVR